MATKAQVATHKAFLRGKKQAKVREEKQVLWLLTAGILLLLYLLLAQHNLWWPYSKPNLGTAFYTNLRAGTPVPASAGSTTSGSAGTNGSAGAGGSTGLTGSNGSGSSTGSSTSSTTPSVTTFAATVNTGNTMAQVSDAATGLQQNCAILVTTSAPGQEQVCTYTQGDKIVTVTYLNGRVISASKSGF